MAVKSALWLLPVILAPMASANERPIDTTKGCKSNPAVVGSCFSVTGRISVYNGSPVIRIVPKGSKRIIGVLPSENELMPADLKDRVNLDQEATADMQVCPFSKAKRGLMQFVCIESAKNIKILKR